MACPDSGLRHPGQGAAAEITAPSWIDTCGGEALVRDAVASTDRILK